MLGDSCLSKLNTVTKGTKRFGNPHALSGALAAFGMLQPQAFGLLNHLVPLVLALTIIVNVAHTRVLQYIKILVIPQYRFRILS